MPPLRLSDEEAARLHALVLLQRYSLGLDRVAESALGNRGTDSLDLQVLLTIDKLHDGGPSEVVAALGLPRSTVSRGLARLLDERLVVRGTHPVDRRRAELRLTELGRRGVQRFERSLADYYVQGEPLVKEVMHLLGRRPERVAARQRRVEVREVAERQASSGAAYARDVRLRMRPFGVGEALERDTLTMLATRRARPSNLADELELSPAGVTSLLDRLEGLGLVVRESGGVENDLRAVLVYLTPRGRRAARVVLETFGEHQGALLDSLEPTLGRDDYRPAAAVG
jgi:DNA-binding MarR family transcriptional regulator